MNDEFERTCNTDEYETKVTVLLKNARDRDGAASPGSEQEWKDALQALRDEDDYILIMAERAFHGEAGPGGTGSLVFNYLIYAAIGIALVLFLVWKSSR